MESDYYIPVIFMLLGILACNTTPQRPEPSEINANYIQDCGNLLMVRLRNLTINSIASEPIIDQETNQIQAFIFLSDGTYESQLNYHSSGSIEVTNSTVVPLRNFWVATDFSERKPIYLWLLVLDRDDFDLVTDLGLSIATELTGMLAEAGSNLVFPGSGPFAGFGTEYVLGHLSEYVESADVVGDVAFILDESNGWGQGVYPNYTSINGNIRFDFSIQQTTGCNSAIGEFSNVISGNDTSQNVYFQANSSRCGSSPFSQIEIGDMVMVDVANGRHLFFRSAPSLSSSGVRYARGHILRVLEGPACDGDTMFWRVVDWRDREGWMAENQYYAPDNASYYFLKPLENGA